MMFSVDFNKTLLDTDVLLKDIYTLENASLKVHLGQGKCAYEIWFTNDYRTTLKLSVQHGIISEENTAVYS